jgi:heat shock protein HslJ
MNVDVATSGPRRARRVAAAAAWLLLLGACRMMDPLPAAPSAGSQAEVPVRSEPSAAEIRAGQAPGRGAQAGVAPRDEPLLDTYWKLVELGGRPVVLQGQQREPHLILHREGSRVSGHGGCNRLNGSYKLAQAQLSFGNLVSTRMACTDGFRQEPAFTAALAACASWRVQGEHLELFDRSGARLARFEVRHL